MKKLRLLILWILSIIWLSSFCFADFTENWFDYPSWVYWSESLWLITAIWNQEIITIKDKNLGATTVYEYWDTLSEVNAWKLFQWWNNYWFPFAWSVSVWGLSADLTQYWPWNYFYSDVFVKNSNFSSTNWNLWWDTTNTLEARQWPCETWYHVPSSSEFTTLYNIYIFNWWTSSNWDLFTHFYKLPIAWFRVSYSAETAVWWEWMYWSSTPAPRASIQLHFTSSSIHPNYDLVWWYWWTIRPFKNSYVLPDSSWVALVWSSEGLPAPSNPGGWGGALWWWWWWWGDELWIAQEPFDPTSYIIRMYASCYWYSWNLPEWFWYSWYYTDCNINYTWFANTFWWHIQSDWSVVYDSWYDILNFMCNNTSYFNYAFCEDLDKYQWSQVWYNISSFPPKMVVVASWFAWVSEIGSWWYLYNPNCYGAWCSETSLGPSFLIWNTWSVDSWSTDTWSTWFPSRFDIPDLSFWEIFSLDYFKNFISSNLLFACPFVLNTWNINITLPEKFESYLWNYNPLNPIKCFTKAFKVWKEFTLYKSWVLSFDFWSWEYLFNSDSDLAKTFYSFIDIILSLWIVIFFLKIFKLLK